MLDVKEKSINGKNYKVRILGALTGRKVLTRLVKLAGPAMAGADQNKGAKFFGDLLEGLDTETVDYLCDLFAKQTFVEINEDGKQRTPLLSDVFDAHFAANYGDLVAWLLFCLEANFASFFAGLGLNLALAPSPETVSPSSSPQESTAPSGV